MSADVIDLRDRLPLPATADPFGFAPIPEIESMRQDKILGQVAKLLEMIDEQMTDELKRHADEMDRMQMVLRGLQRAVSEYLADVQRNGTKAT